MNRYRWAAFFVMGCFYLAIPNARPDFTRFNCNDSEAYLSLAWNLSHGRGYTRSLVESIYIPHTTWPPGTPLLMVPATILSGSVINWYSVKWTMCIVGLIGVALTWLFIKRVVGNVFVADLGALFIGLNPLYWDFSHQAMAEIPLTVWLIGGLLLVDRVWAGRRVVWYQAVAAGLVCGVAMLFKGHGGGLVFAPLGYLWGPRRSSSTLLISAAMWLLFASGFSVPQFVWMARNRTVAADGFDGINRFRSILAVNPNDAESSLVNGREFAVRVVDNTRHYAIFRLPEQIIPGLWPIEVWDWPGSGFIALFLSIMILALAFPRSASALPPIFAAIPMVLLNIAYAFGGAARFWLPISVMIMLSIVINFGPKLVRLTFGRLLACAVILLANLIIYAMDHEIHPYNQGEPWQEFAELLDEIHHEPGFTAVGVLTHNPEAFQLATGLPAPFGKEGLLYDYVVIDSRRAKPPTGGRLVITKSPWMFVALPRAMTGDEIARLMPQVE